MKKLNYFKKITPLFFVTFSLSSCVPSDNVFDLTKTLLTVSNARVEYRLFNGEDYDITVDERYDNLKTINLMEDINSKNVFKFNLTRLEHTNDKGYQSFNFEITTPIITEDLASSYALSLNFESKAQSRNYFDYYIYKHKDDKKMLINKDSSFYKNETPWEETHSVLIDNIPEFEVSFYYTFSFGFRMFLQTDRNNNNLPIQKPENTYVKVGNLMFIDKKLK